MRSRAVRRAERYVGLAVLASVSSVAGAQDVQTQVLVSTGGSVETNPYNEANGGGAQIAGTLNIQPMMRVRDERTTIDVGGSANFRQFLRRYGLEDNYNLNSSIATRLNERVTLRSTSDFSYNQGGLGNFDPRTGLPGAPDPLDPVNTLPDPIFIDPTIIGQRARLKSFNIGVGTDVKLNDYSSLSMNFSGRALRYDGFGFGRFNTVGADGSYSHQLSEFTSIGLIGSVSKTDYLDTQVGDARTISLMASGERRLNSNWSLSGSGGIAITKVKQGLGLPDQKFSSFTARLGFCRRGEFSQLCLNGSRSPEPTANGGVRVSNTLGASYSLRVSDRETISLNGAYAHTGRGHGFVTPQQSVSFVSGAARYDKQLGERLTFYAGTNFSRVYSTGTPKRTNVGVNAGVQFRFGALQ